MARVRAWVVADPWLKLLSVALAAVAWLWVQGKEVATEPVRIDLAWHFADDVLPATPPPASATAIVQGPRAAIRRARVERPRIRVELEVERRGRHEVRLGSYGVEGLPSGLAVVAFAPEDVSIELDDRAQRRLPVSVVTVGRPADRHVLGAIGVEPEVVRVEGPRTALAALRAVDTAPIDVSGWDEPRQVPVALELPVGLATVEPWTGRASIEVDSLTAEQTIRGVPVIVWGRSDWAPAEGSETLTVTLRGPAEVLRSLRVDHVLARVEIPADGARDRYTARYQADRAPRLEIVVPRPDVVEVAGVPGPVEVVRR
jgi:YbbR domain-containing protein